MMPRRLSTMQNFNTAKVLVAVISIISFLSFPYIPKKYVNVYPESSVWWGAYTDSFSGGNSTFVYSDETQNGIKCFIGDIGTFNMCGSSGVFAENTVVTRDRLLADANFSIAISPSITRDFSHFSGMWVDVDYRGPADFIFLLLQNHEPALDLPNPDRQFRSQSVGVSISELHQPAYVSLKDFKVADWWVTRYSLHRTQAGVRFDRIYAFGIEIKDQPKYSEHYLKVRSITFVGEWISKENFYSLIIIVLSALLLLEVAVRVYNLYVKQRATQKSLETLNEHNQRLQSAAYRDELTQLLNRRAIHEVVLNNSVVGQNKCIAIFVIDIDHFKLFNDTYGHALGDRVLVDVAKSLTNASRDYDKIARWGGEEFIVLTRETQPENLLIYAEKLRNEAASIAIFSEHHAEPINVTVSIGIALSRVDESFEKAFERADEALYQSKRNGRNCCTLSS